MTPSLSGLAHPSAAEVTAFVLAFVVNVGLWWIYFDRAAEDSARVIAESDDPGRLGRNAFHWIHPLIAGAAVLVVLVPLAPRISGLALGVATLFVVAGIAVADRVQHGPAHVSSPLPDGS